MKIDAAGSKIDLPASWARFFGSLGPKQGSKIDFGGAPGPEKKKICFFLNTSMVLIESGEVS